MNLAAAIAARNAAELPGKRDEDWRWTDLRGLIRSVPDASPAGLSPAADGPFGAGDLVMVNAGSGEIVVPAGAERRVALRFVAIGGGSHSARLAVRLGQGAKLTLLESHEGDDAGYLALASLDLQLAEGASAERIVLAEDGRDGVRVCQAEVVLSPGAIFAQTVLTDGARRQRFETRIAHPGAGAAVRMDGGYLLGAKRHADLTSEVRHGGVGGRTSQLAKGIVRDQARCVFQGRIVVEEGADETDARMGHHALVLSDQAEVDAKPELLIFADDVQCAHGNTVGALDEAALFYMRQRGLPELGARALLMAAFVGEVVERIEDEAARDGARSWLGKRIGA